MALRSRKIIYGILGTSAAILVATAAPAAAQTWGYSANMCGYTQFQSYGDKFLIEDLCTDGRGVRVRFQYKYSNGTWSGYHYAHWRGGYNAGNPADFTFSWVPENRSVRFQVGLEDGGVYVPGSYGATHTALS